MSSSELKFDDDVSSSKHETLGYEDIACNSGEHETRPGKTIDDGSAVHEEQLFTAMLLSSIPVDVSNNQVRKALHDSGLRKFSIWFVHTSKMYRDAYITGGEDNRLQELASRGSIAISSISVIPQMADIWECGSCRAANYTRHDEKCQTCGYVRKVNGACDIGSSDTSFVLLLSIPTDTEDEALFSQLRSITTGLRRLIRALRMSDSSPAGFAFLEFESTAMAQLGLKALQQHQSLGAVRQIHYSVFQPEYGQKRGGFFTESGNLMNHWNSQIYLIEYPEAVYDTEEAAQMEEGHPSQSKKRKGGPNNARDIGQLHPHIHQWQKHRIQVRSDQELGHQESFADSSRNTCYLCYRKFASGHELNAHERMSELHRYNLSNTVRVEKARKIGAQLRLRSM